MKASDPEPSSAAGRPWYWLDVFSDRPLAGNGLAVVLDADGLSPETMLAFAREVGLSETTFVQTATAEGADYRNRIWTIGGEIPFAGHPSLGTAVAVADHRSRAGSRLAEGPGDVEVGFRQQTEVGVQDVRALLADGGWTASVTQEAAVFGETIDRDRVAKALELPVGRLDPELSCQIASTGLPALLAPVADLEALRDCRPDFDALRSIDDRAALNLYAFVYSRGSRGVKARCFGADMSGAEDPATGSAVGPLVAYLQDCLDIDRIVVEQGVEMGRPSLIEACMEDGRPVVSGAVSIVSSGEVFLPGAEA